jgi:hypothetical protein
MQIVIPADQVTAHESNADEARVGRFSRGMERARLTPSALHRGRFSEGVERLVDTRRTRRPGSFADGLTLRDGRRAARRRGNFALAQRDEARR